MQEDFPQGDRACPTLRELVDISELQCMMEALYKAALMPCGICDALDGTLLAGAGWPDICARFHRNNPITLARCLESNVSITNKLKPGETCAYKCGNGLWDIGIPIMVRGRHLATLFLGQFFYEGEETDSAFFAKQADECGFDKAAYLEALSQVPVFTREKVEDILRYDLTFAVFLGHSAEHVLTSREQLEASRHAQTKLRESENRLELALKAGDLGLWDWDIVTDEVHFNETWASMLGFSLEDLPQTLETWKRLVHPEDMPKVMAVLTAHLEGRSSAYSTEHRLLTKDGAWRWVLDQGKVVARDASGKPLRAVGTHQDITERKSLEEALRESEERYRLLFMSQLDAFALHEIIVDAAGRPVDYRYLAVNAAFEKLLGLPAEKILNRTVLELLPGTERHWIETYGRVALTGETVFFENYSVELQRYFAVSSYSPHPGQFAVVVRDVTERFRTEQELTCAKKAAEAASRAKSEFLATMSHEIRSPLNGVLGMLQLAMTTNLDPEQKKYVSTAMQAGRSLLRVLSDILDISRIEAGALDIVAEDFHPAEVFEPIAQSFRGEARAKGLEFSCMLDPALPESLCGDAGRIRQVIYNLVGNALKYTERGTVRLEAMTLPWDTVPGSLRLVLTVSDTGIGVPAEKIQGIFDVFTQVDGSYTRRYGGTGLGLSIVKHLVRLMGGTIEFCSRVGTGTDVLVVLPLRLGRPSARPEPQPAASPEPAAASPGLDVLLAEDDLVNRLTVSHMLDKAGHRVHAVGNGVEALAYLAGHRVDCVLMDIQMPELDGLKATRLIRAGQTGATPGDVPIIAITAYAMKGDRDHFLSAGMDGYISKPVDMVELERVLAGIPRGGKRQG